MTQCTDVENVLSNPSSVFVVLLCWFFLSVLQLWCKNLNPLAVSQEDNSSFIVAPIATELALLRNAGCCFFAPFVIFALFNVETLTSTPLCRTLFCYHPNMFFIFITNSIEGNMLGEYSGDDCIPIDFFCPLFYL